MNDRELFALLSDLPDDMITEAAGIPKKKHISVFSVIPAIAACVALLTAVVLYPRLRQKKPHRIETSYTDSTETGTQSSADPGTTAPTGQSASVTTQTSDSAITPGPDTAVTTATTESGAQSGTASSSVTTGTETVTGTGTSDRTTESPPPGTMSSEQTTACVTTDATGITESPVFTTEPPCDTTYANYTGPVFTTEPPCCTTLDPIICTTDEPVCTTMPPTVFPGAEAVYQWRSEDNSGTAETDTFEWFTDTLPDWLQKEAPALTQYDFRNDCDLLLITVRTAAQEALFCGGNFTGTPDVIAMVVLKNSPGGSSDMKTYRIGIIRKKDYSAPSRLCFVGRITTREANYERIKKTQLANGLILLTPL